MACLLGGVGRGSEWALAYLGGSRYGGQVLRWDVATVEWGAGGREGFRLAWDEGW